MRMVAHEPGHLVDAPLMLAEAHGLWIAREMHKDLPTTLSASSRVRALCSGMGKPLTFCCPVLNHRDVRTQCTSPSYGSLSGWCSHIDVTGILQMYGSSGLQTRPENGTLQSFTKCLPVQHKENLHIKTLANTRFTLGPQGDPHHFKYAPGKYAVNTRFEQVRNSIPCLDTWDWLGMEEQNLDALPAAQVAKTKIRGP
jgi:hypothetical protein